MRPINGWHTYSLHHQYEVNPPQSNGSDSDFSVNTQPNWLDHLLPYHPIQNFIEFHNRKSIYIQYYTIDTRIRKN